MSKEHGFRGSFDARERPFDWRGLAEAYGIAEQDARELYEEAMRRARASQEEGRHHASIYVNLLDQVRSGAQRPAPGKVTRTSRLAGARQRLPGQRAAPGKVALTSYLSARSPVGKRDETRAAHELAELLGIVENESAWRDEAAPLAAQLDVDPEIRADDDARQRTDARGARGLATESAIYLHPERIAPGTSEGRRVLIHELVHVAQAKKQQRGAVPDRAAAEAEAAAAAAEQRVAPPAHAIDLGAQAAADVDADPAPTPAARRSAKRDGSGRPDLTRTPYQWIRGTYRLWVKKAWFTGASDLEITGRGWCAPSRSREILAHLRDQGVLDWARPDAIARAAERIAIAPLTADVAEVDLGASLVGALGLPPGAGAAVRRGPEGDLEVIVALTGPAAGLRGEFPLSPAHMEQIVTALERATGLSIEGIARVELGGGATRTRLASGRAHTPVSRSDLERWFGADRYRSWLDRAAEAGPEQEALAVQARGRVSGDGSWVRARAAEGVAGSSSTMPYRGEIQAAFGRHDVGTIDAHVGGAAADAAAAIGAEAYAAGERIAFAGPPDLHTAAHEAAHVVQQRGGVELAGGVGRAGDAYERHADAVADRVVAGRSAEALLDQMAGGSRAAAVQLRSDDATVQLDKGEAVAAEDQALANPPPATMSVQFSGLDFTTARGTKWVAGIDKTLLAHAMTVRALVGEAAYSPELARQADRHVRSFGEYSASSGVSGRAVQDEEMGSFKLDPTLALDFITFLRDAKKLRLTLTQDRIDKLLLGNDIKEAWFFIKNVEPPLPAWYGENLFWDQILAEQYQPLILEFRAKVTALLADRNARTKAAVKEALNALVAPLRPDAALLERVRTDASLTNHRGYRKLWGLAPVDPARPNVATAAADAAVEPETAARFLQQARSDRAAGAQAREDGPEASKARRRLLDGMQAVADVVDEKEDATGDAELRSTASVANAPPLPSRLSAYPALPYPHTKPRGTTHTFTMDVQYPSHTLEALGALFDNVYTWETIRVPNESFERLADTAADEKAKGYRPSFTGVAGQAAARQWGYLDADQKRVRGALEGLEVVLGPMMVGVESLLVANRAVGVIGKVVKTAIHELFETSDQETVLFDQEPGLYVVRCRVHRRANEESRLVRADSVAWHAVLVREPQKVASEALEGQLRGRSYLDQRLREIEARLASGSVSDPKEVAALEEEGADIRIALYGSVEGTLVAERQTLEKRRRELQGQRKAGGAPPRAVAQELEQIDKRLDDIAQVLKVRRGRHEEHTVSGLEGPVRIPAAFVGDEGNVLSLVLEAIEQPGQEGKFVYHVTDATTKDSSQATGSPQGSRADAIADAVKCLLEKASGYGQGYVTIHVPAPGGRVVSLADDADAAPHMRQIRIESDLTAIAMQGVDNIATALSIAAVVAAPLTGGASLAFLVPIGAVGAIPSAYRLLDRAESGTLRLDLDTAMDIVNIVGGVAGIGQVAKVGLRSVPLGRGLMMIGLGSDRLGVALAGAKLIEEARNIDPNAPPGVRLAMLAEIFGAQLIDMGIDAGTALARRGQALKAQHAGAGADAGLKLGSVDLHRAASRRGEERRADLRGHLPPRQHGRRPPRPGRLRPRHERARGGGAGSQPGCGSQARPGRRGDRQVRAGPGPAAQPRGPRNRACPRLGGAWRRRRVGCGGTGRARRVAGGPAPAPAAGGGRQARPRRRRGRCRRPAPPDGAPRARPRQGGSRPRDHAWRRGPAERARDRAQTGSARRDDEQDPGPATRGDHGPDRGPAARGDHAAVSGGQGAVRAGHEGRARRRGQRPAPRARRSSRPEEDRRPPRLRPRRASGGPHRAGAPVHGRRRLHPLPGHRRVATGSARPWLPVQGTRLRQLAGVGRMARGRAGRQGPRLDGGQPDPHGLSRRRRRPRPAVVPLLQCRHRDRPARQLRPRVRSAPALRQHPRGWRSTWMTRRRATCTRPRWSGTCSRARTSARVGFKDSDTATWAARRRETTQTGAAVPETTSSIDRRRRLAWSSTRRLLRAVTMPYACSTKH